MARTVAMWIAVISLAALGVVSATLALIFIKSGNTGWTFYTPYSVSSGPASDLETLCGLAQRVLLPIAAIATAIYLYLAEGALRRLHVRRGFEMEVNPKADDK